MDEQTLRVLEFDQVLQAAASLAETPLGAARVLALTPTTTEGDSVRLELDRVAEVLRFLELEEGLELDRVAEVLCFLELEERLDLGGLHDLAPFGERLSAEGGYLRPEELALFGQTLICLGRLKRRLNAAGREYPLLGRMAGRLAEHPDLIADLGRTLGPGLTIADEASPELASLRRRSQRTKGQVRSRLEELLGRHRSRGLWQDEIITQRSGRFVLPLKSERQGGLEGIIHDYSASGQTAFLEPVEVVGLNNELGHLSAQERREIERILTRLTDRLRAIGPELFAEVEAAAEVDGLQARARLASRQDAIRPELDEGGRLDLRQARHPLLLLSGRPTVPVDLAFGPGVKILIVSGPNAGGKTVALKTLGLLVLMAQAGLLIPVTEGSRLPVLKGVRARIGDEQDLSEGKSTYSARLNWLKTTLAVAGAGWLVLIDELGSGTDPAEGAALSLAGLDELARKEALVLGTTHINFIKAYAAGRADALNLSVRFDEAGRRPTYELVYGQPGMSSAFEIAERIGLDGAVISQARDYLGDEGERFAGLLRAVVDLAEEHRQALTELAGQQQRLNEALTRAQEEGKRLGRERWAIIEREGAKIKELLARTEKELTGVLEEAASPEARQRERARYRFHEEKGRLLRAITPPEPPAGPAARFSPGQAVRVAGFARPGVLVNEADKDGLAEVRLAGGMRVKVAPGRLTPETNPPASSDQRKKVALGPSREAIWPEINIVGLRVEEALLVVDKALDDAVLSGTDRLAIVHGLGTGALRRAVREFLVEHPQVRRVYSPEGSRGAAITQAELAD